jgi:hypothetical protein
MATRSTLNSFAMDFDSASQISSMLASSQINIPTELQHTNDFASNTGNRPITQPVKLTYYNEINFNHVAPGYTPCVDGKGQVNSWIWAHGWRLQQQDTVKPVYYWLIWLCKICYKQRKHLAKLIKCSSGTTRVHNHLQGLHSINKHGKQVRKRLFDAKTPSTPSYGAAIDTYMIPFDPAEFKALLLDHVVAENQAYTTIESTRRQAILKYLNPAVDQRGCLPVYKTIHN